MIHRESMIPCTLWWGRDLLHFHDWRARWNLVCRHGDPHCLRSKLSTVQRQARAEDFDVKWISMDFIWFHNFHIKFHSVPPRCFKTWKVTEIPARRPASGGRRLGLPDSTATGWPVASDPSWPMASSLEVVNQKRFGSLPYLKTKHVKFICVFIHVYSVGWLPIPHDHVTCFARRKQEDM